MFDEEEDETLLLAEGFLRTMGFTFQPSEGPEVRRLLEEERLTPRPGGSEYLRVLCGYLFCIGNPEDAGLLKAVKYGVSFDVGCMIDSAWLDCLMHMPQDPEAHQALKEEYVSYYTRYFNL